MVEQWQAGLYYPATSKMMLVATSKMMLVGLNGLMKRKNIPEQGHYTPDSRKRDDSDDD